MPQRNRYKDMHAWCQQMDNINGCARSGRLGFSSTATTYCASHPDESTDELFPHAADNRQGILVTRDVSIAVEARSDAADVESTNDCDLESCDNDDSVPGKVDSAKGTDAAPARPKDG